MWTIENDLVPNLLPDAFAACIFLGNYPPDIWLSDPSLNDQWFTTDGTYKTVEIPIIQQHNDPKLPYPYYTKTSGTTTFNNVKVWTFNEGGRAGDGTDWHTDGRVGGSYGPERAADFFNYSGRWGSNSQNRGIYFDGAHLHSGTQQGASSGSLGEYYGGGLSKVKFENGCQYIFIDKLTQDSTETLKGGEVDGRLFNTIRGDSTDSDYRYQASRQNPEPGAWEYGYFDPEFFTDTPETCWPHLPPRVGTQYPEGYYLGGTQEADGGWKFDGFSNASPHYSTLVPGYKRNQFLVFKLTTTPISNLVKTDQLDGIKYNGNYPIDGYQVMVKSQNNLFIGNKTAGVSTDQYITIGGELDTANAVIDNSRALVDLKKKFNNVESYVIELDEEEKTAYQKMRIQKVS